MVVPSAAVSEIPTAHERLVERAAAWRVTVDDVFETAGSLIAYGRRTSEPVVLKIVKRPGDEWYSGVVLTEFGGHGVVRVHEHSGGAALLERLRPGNSLVDLTLSGRDDEATAHIAGVIRAMTSSPVAGSNAYPTVQDWGKGFAWYAASGDRRISSDLVSHAHHLYDDLCRSQSTVRLLHGDLQHSNIRFDEERGWVAIDPKGVIGETEYEIGAALRNPREAPSTFTAPATIERRIRRLSSDLALDATRVLEWAFAQAVLSAIWVIEDGETFDAAASTMILAETMRRMLPSFSS